MDSRKKLSEAAAQRILILDGAMGSMIMAFRSPEGKPLSEEDFQGARFAQHHKKVKGCNDLLCLTKPELIAGIHEAYLDAGADIITTCSFNSSSVSLKDFGLESLSREISAAAAALARKAADKFSSSEKPRFVAGSLGPTAKSVAFTPDMDRPWERQISWDDLEAAYYENAKGLVEGGVDFLLIETVFDSLNAKAALSAVKRLSRELDRDIPAMVSATISEGDRLLTSQTSDAFFASMLPAEPWALSLNCSFGVEKLKAPLEKLSAFAPCLVGFYPNAGLPDREGLYRDTPEIMAAAAETCMKEGLVNIIGGCCGATPAHIAAIAKKAQIHKPRIIPAAPRNKTLLAGTETVEIDDEDLAGLKDAVRPWQSALDEGDYEEAIEIAREEAEKSGCTEDSLKILVINTDKAPDPVKTMRSFIFLASAFSDLAKLPILIESASRDVIEGGLKCFQGRGLVSYIGP
jgi:5-methyltetrahydrofolate--homocysteine methyltransferase